MLYRPSFQKKLRERKERELSTDTSRMSNSTPTPRDVKRVSSITGAIIHGPVRPTSNGKMNAKRKAALELPTLKDMLDQKK